MNPPKVTIICLCYNHQQYVEEAIDSAFSQDYQNIEVIAVDDASSDASQEALGRLTGKYPDLQLIINSSNIGNCGSFNKAFAMSNGDFLIDLAADDILALNRVSIGIRQLEEAGDSYGVHYCDHEWISPTGKSLGYQYERSTDGSILSSPPTGDIYVDNLNRYFISAPTMMMRREVLEELDGYDESLTYEDFDFWLRSSRNWRYLFSDHTLVKKRRLKKSLSSAQFKFRSEHDRSTFKVCQKALALNRNEKEHQALKDRLVYERKHAIANGNLRLAQDYHQLIGEVDRAIKGV